MIVHRGITAGALRTVIIIPALCLLFVSSACHRQLNSDKRPMPASQSPGRISLQEEPEVQSLPEISVPQVEQEKHPDYNFNKAEHVFDLDLPGVELGTVLQTMCNQLELNLVLDPKVQDTLNLNLKGVTFFKFLDIVLPRKNYTYRLEENFLYVNAPGLRTKVFNLNYLNTARQITGTMTLTGQGGGAAGGLISQSTTTLQTQNTVNLWEDIRNGLQAIVLGTGAQITPGLNPQGNFSGVDNVTGHRLVVDPNSGVVQITASESILGEASNFIDAIENSLQRQVLIEARFIEINLSENFEAGLDWSVIPDLTNFSNLKGALAGGAVAGQALNPNQSDFQIGVSNKNINALMSAISQHGTVNVLQSPQVSTLNNQPAVIRVARNETFFQRTETPGQPATATSAATQAVVNYVPIQQPTGVVLNLTPQISGDGMIIMSIRPSITTIASVAVSPDGLSTSPITDVRELDTVAKVRHGQTVVLAGLIQERDNNDTRGVPGLSKVPLFGNLFKQVQKKRDKIELVIMLTPYINYSRPTEQLSSQQQLNRYREVVKRYEFGEGQFRR